MEMEISEIVRSFKGAKDRRKQIVILSELNLCSVEEIRSALIEGGVSWRELPRTKRANKQTVAANAGREAAAHASSADAVQESPPKGQPRRTEQCA